MADGSGLRVKNGFWQVEDGLQKYVRLNVRLNYFFKRFIKYSLSITSAGPDLQLGPFEHWILNPAAFKITMLLLQA